MDANRAALAEQVVFVAGASSGIGRAVAVAAAGAGAAVVVAARNTRALSELATELRANGGRVLPVAMDATDADSVAGAIEQAVAAFGRLDALVNTVGANIKRRAIDELTAESWSTMLATNLTSAFNLTQAVLPALRAQGGGLIVHTASSAARRPDRSGVAYQAAKAAVVGLAHGTMEEERAHGVRTTVIFPGLTDTPLVLQRPTPTPPEVLARALQPEDVAAACLFVLALPARAHVPELLIYPSQA